MSTLLTSYSLFVLANLEIGKIVNTKDIIFIPFTVKQIFRGQHDAATNEIKHITIAAVKSKSFSDVSISDNNSLSLETEFGKLTSEPLEKLQMYLSCFQLSHDDSLENFPLELPEGKSIHECGFDMAAMPMISNLIPLRVDVDSSITLNELSDDDKHELESIAQVELRDFPFSFSASSDDFNQADLLFNKVSDILIRDDMKTKRTLKNILLTYQSAKEGRNFVYSIPSHIAILESMFSFEENISKQIQERIPKYIGDTSGRSRLFLRGVYGQRNDIAHLKSKFDLDRNQYGIHNRTKQHLASLCSVLIRKWIDEIYDGKTRKSFRNSILPDDLFKDESNT